MERLKSDETFDDKRRFEAISQLRKELGLSDIETTIELTAEQMLSPLSIGIEIEMTWRQAFPELAKKWPVSSARPRDLDPQSEQYKQFCEEYDRFDGHLKPVLETIRQVIPRVGQDAYWEFSFLPTRNMAVTKAELDILYATGILRNEEQYSLHMTVAGIDNDRDAFAFLCDLELSGGTAPGRILHAAESAKGAWARKGSGGLMKRRANELIGDDTIGYEFRTLVARSHSQVNSTMLRAAHLAHLIKLPLAWKQHRADVEATLLKNGLELKAWDRPKDELLPWLKYAALLESANNFYV